ncbi:MAG: hypothetical protein M2R45_05188 [Verrucomicrobia subdivision 3 bacterium]|nr:hypothetical protein [Limisphaerales bacterium]MCS1417587.1 hypothetical protein [Limisphaerales bacterium]
MVLMKQPDALKRDAPSSDFLALARKPGPYSGLYRRQSPLGKAPTAKRSFSLQIPPNQPVNPRDILKLLRERGANYDLCTAQPTLEPSIKSRKSSDNHQKPPTSRPTASAYYPCSKTH